MYVLYEMIVKYRIMCIFFYIFILKKNMNEMKNMKRIFNFYVYLFICKKIVVDYLLLVGREIVLIS